MKKINNDSCLVLLFLVISGNPTPSISSTCLKVRGTGDPLIGLPDGRPFRAGRVREKVWCKSSQRRVHPAPTSASRVLGEDLGDTVLVAEVLGSCGEQRKEL